VTSRYLLIVPNERNPIGAVEYGKRRYCLIRWPKAPVCRCGHEPHPRTLCAADAYCMCTAGEDEDGEYLP
jgi:hypothetical protein